MKRLFTACLFFTLAFTSLWSFASYAPQNFTATVSGNSINFSWSPVSATAICYGESCTFSHYVLTQTGVTLGTYNGEGLRIANRSTTSVTLNNLSVGQHEFSLGAYYIYGTDDYDFFSTQKITVTVSNGVPQTPANISATLNGTSVVVNWSAVQSASSYELQRNAVNLTSTSTTGYTDSSAAAGSTNSYRVRACNTAGCSGWTTNQAVVQIPPIPGVPYAFGVESLSSYIRLSWQTTMYATTYDVRRDNVIIASPAIATSAGVGVYEDRAVTPGVSYNYTVRACNVSGCGGWASAYIGRIAAIPAPPGTISASQNGFAVQVSWNESTDATSYELQRNSSALTTTESAYYDDTSIVAGNSYVYRVRACNALGCSGWVSSASLTIQSIPTAPASITATPGSSSIALSWQSSSGATSYQLQRNSVPFASVSITTHTDSSAVINTSYIYSVRACNAIGCSAFTASSPVQLITVPISSSIRSSSSSLRSSSSVISSSVKSSSSLSSSLRSSSSSIRSSSSSLRSSSSVISSSVKSSSSLSSSLRSSSSSMRSSSSVSSSSSNSSIVWDKAGFDPINDDLGINPLYMGDFSGKYSVDESGAFNYSIPIVVPPGINGMEPELSLAYNSKNGNGLLGYGWSVSEVGSSIHRCRSDLVRDGRVSGTKDDDAFKYCFNGTRMVEVSPGEYRLENDPTKKIVMQSGSRFPLGWVVYSSDGKIREYGGSSDAVLNQAEYFLKKKKDLSGNYVLYTYVNDSINGTHKIYSIAYTKNESGLQGLNNEIIFGYESRLDTASYYSSGYKRQLLDRLEKISIKVSGSEVRSYRINYEAIDGNLYADPANTSRIVKISKCDLIGECPEINFKWNDFNVSQLAANSSQSDYSLTEYDDVEVDNYIVDGNEQLGDTYLVPSAGERFLYGNDFVIGDFDGDNKKEAIWKNCTEASCKHYVKMSKNSPALLFADVPGVVRSEVSEFHPGNGVAVLYHYDRYRAGVLDINSDGIEDYYLNSQYNGIKFYISDGNQLALSSGYSIDGSLMRKHGTVNMDGGSITAFWGYATEFVDVNGDGLLDLIKMPAVNENTNVVQSIMGLGETGIYVAINTGVGFSNFSRWGTMTDYQTSMKIPVYYIGVLGDTVQSKNFVAQFADVNGDGLKDILGYLPGVGVEVGINTGSSFVYQSNWANWAAPVVPTSSDPRYKGAYACPYNSTSIYLKNIIHEVYRYGDINGDGLTDIIFLDNNGVNVSIATGSSYLPPVLWSNKLTLKDAVCGTTTHDGSSINGQNYLIRRGKADWKVVDYNKDGRGDIGLSIKNTAGSPSKNHLDIMFSVGGQGGQQVFSSPVRVYSDNWDSYIPFPINDISVSENGNPFVIKGKKGTSDVAGPMVRFENYSKIYDRGMHRIPIDVHELKEITARNGSATSKIDVSYKNLNRNSSIYSASVKPNAAALFSPKAPTVHTSNESVVNVGYDPTRTAYAPKFKLVDKVDYFVSGVKQNHTNYKYENYRFNQKGWGSLGFEKIENTVTYSKKLIITSTEYLQEIGAGYKLVEPAKTTQIVVRPQDGEIDSQRQMIKEDRFSYKVRLLADDIDGYSSPRYLSFIHDHEEKKYDFNSGSLMSTVLWRSYNDGITNNCPLFTDVSATNRLSNQNAYVDDFGNLLDITQYHCDFFGVVGSRTRNTNIVNDRYLWQIGLIKDPYEHTWIYDTASNTLDEKVRHSSFTFDEKGRVKAEIREPNASANIKLTIDRKYNGYGSIFTISETVEDFSGDGVDFLSRSITKNERFEANGDREIETVNDYGHVLTQVFEPVFGVERDTIDVNGLVTSRLYDRAGRLTKITYPDNSKEELQYRSCNSCFEYNNSSAWLLQTKVTGRAAQVEYFDGLNRSVGTKSRALNGDYNFTANEYNSDGTLHSLSAPFRSGGTIFKTIHDYDPLGRVVSTVFPNSGTQYVNHATNGGLVSTTTTDSLGNQKTQQFDALNREKKIIDSLGTVTSYNYDALGNIKQIEVKGKNGELPISHSIKYDLLSRKTELNDPDVGKITYGYNAFGHLVSQTNAENQTVKYVYDKLDRQVNRIDPPSTTDLYSRTHTWSYDNKPYGVGLLSGVTGYDTQGRGFSEQYSYNNYSQLTDTDFLIDGKSYRITNVYDNFSRSIGLVYPTGFAVGYPYNNYGFNDKVVNARSKANLWSAANDDAYGNIINFSFGNGASTQKAFSPDTGLIDTIRVTKASETIQNHDYDFDTEGNLRKRSDGRVAITQRFCYDTLYRLTSSVLNQTCNDVINGNYSSAQFAYNIHGNITKKDNISDYRYGENAGPHAVTFANGKSYQYDKAGRMKGGTGRIIEYSAFGKPVYLSRDSYQTQIVYGPLEKRIRRMDIESGALTTTTYIDKLYEKIESPTGVEHRHYVSDFGIYVVDEAAQQSYNVYQHFDHIGSIAAKTDDRLTSTTRLQANEPWGQRQDKTWSGQVYPYLTGTALKEMTFGTNRGFTGHEHLDAVGLIHMNGRVYDPVLGRFVSPDPWIQDPKNSQSFNRYSYVWNNPLRYTDPTGEQTTTYCVVMGCENTGGSVERRKAGNNSSEGEGGIEFDLERVEAMSDTPEGITPIGFAGVDTFLIGLVDAVNQFIENPSASSAVSGALGSVPIPGAKKLGDELADKVKGLDKATGDLSADTPNVNTPVDVKVDVDAPAVNNAEAVHPGQTGTYGELKAQKREFGETEPLDMDHQPSFAAQVAAKEAALGRELSKAELAVLKANTPAVASPRPVHQQTSPTYGGRNTPSRIAEDSTDLSAAAARDRAVFDEAMKNR